MTRFFRSVVKRRSALCIVFAAITLAAAVCIPFVRVNYDDTAYLPPDSNTSRGLAVQSAEFGGGTAQVLLTERSLADILATKAKLEQVSGVSSVLWADDLLSTVLDAPAMAAYSHEERLALLLRLLAVLPSSAETTPYALADTLQAEFSAQELETVVPMCQALSDVESAAGGDDLGTLVRAVSTPVGSAVPEGARGMRALCQNLSTEPGTAELAGLLIDGTAALNSAGYDYSGTEVARLLSAALAVLPTEEGSSWYALYAALENAFPPDQLPAVGILLTCSGMTEDAPDAQTPQALSTPISSDTLLRMAAAQRMLPALGGLTESAGAQLFPLTDAAAACGLSGSEFRQLLPDLADALPTDENTTQAELALRLDAAFDEHRMKQALALLEALGAPASVSSREISAMTSPLGESYASAISGFSDELERFYRDGQALMTIRFVHGDYDDTTTLALREILALEDDLCLSGNAAASYYSRVNQLGEILRATGLMILVVLAFLFLLSSSWLDPLLYVAVILAAIVLNMGSNLLLPSVSYLTQSVACILQLALSMDYAIFLLHRYKQERKSCPEPEAAMVRALRGAFAPISASSLTTAACFITILFLRYRMGFDMGVVMAKGILFSLLTVFLLLPGLILALDRRLGKAEHRSFRFSCRGLSAFVYRFRRPIVILAVLLLLPCAFISGRNRFVYGSTASQGTESPGLVNQARIESVFGSQEQLVVLIPKDAPSELTLSHRLTELPGVVSVAAWSLIRENGYDHRVPEVMRAQLVGTASYNRIVLTLDCPEEGAETKALLAAVREETESLFSEYYLLGNTAAAEDMEESVSRDYGRISLLSIAAVAGILILTFGSFFIPAILVFVIQGSIWLNLSVPCLLGRPMIFIGYLIVSNILLGSTIDYAILMASNYLEARKTLGVREAVQEAQHLSLRPVLTSGGIFTIGGLILGATSSFPTVQLLGWAIMRGGICAVVLSVLVIPAALSAMDRPLLRFRRKGR